RELLERQERRRAHLVVRERAARDADDPVALRHQTHGREVEEARDDLPLRQVAGHAVEDDDVVRRPLVAAPRHQGMLSAAATSAASERYAEAGSSCQKTALPATSRSAPASRTARALSACTPPSTSAWKVTLSPPASLTLSNWRSGSATIRWQSSLPPRSWTRPEIDLSTTGPIVISLMKWPSPTSKWKIRAPASSSTSSCVPRRA